MRRPAGPAAGFAMLAGRAGLGLALLLAPAAGGCTVGGTTSESAIGPTFDWGDRVVPPSALVEPMRQVYRPGEPIPVTVQIVAPKGREVLDPYLPITGRFHVRRQENPLGLEPVDAKRARVELLPDDRHARTRSFTVDVARAFPMSEPGWYVITWAGEGLDCQLLTVEIAVRVLPGAPTPAR